MASDPVWRQNMGVMLSTAVVKKVANVFVFKVKTGRLHFPNYLRINQSIDFSKVMKQPDYRFTSKEVVILVKKNALSYPRLGLAIGKKNIKKSVERNSVKRLIRERFRLEQYNFPPHDIVVVARKLIIDSSRQELQQSLVKLWTKLKKACVK